MYFDFGDYRPDVPTIGRVISWREGVLLSIIVHVAAGMFLLIVPRLFPQDIDAMRARILAAQEQRLRDQARFVFVQPRVERPAPKPPSRAELSDLDREARSPRRAERPTNTLPFARGNSPERVEAMREQAQRDRGAERNPATGQMAQSTPPSNEIPKVPQSSSPLQLPRSQMPQNSAKGRASTPDEFGDKLRNALHYPSRYAQTEAFNNLEGGGQFGPEIQFDTKGVEFGPWIRQFIAQVKENWYRVMPFAVWTSGLKGHVVITFNVHKTGDLTDLNVVGPAPIDVLNTAAFGALTASNPTKPLPHEYPDEKAFFTVTFFYNEHPPTR